MSLDGTNGEAFIGKRIDHARPGRTSGSADPVGADEEARLEVWANADYPSDAQRSRTYGAKGIGLCRTEHMFFEPERLPIVEKMILNAEEAQKLINNVDRLEGFLETGKLDGQPMQEETRQEVEKELAAGKKLLDASAAVTAYRKALADLIPYQRSDFSVFLR